MTGAEFFKLFQQQGGFAYTGSLVPITANRLFKLSLYDSVEFIYKTLDDQPDYDKIVKLIKTNVSLTPLNNEINLFSVTSPSVASDYLHFLRARAYYTVPLNYHPHDFTNDSPIVMDMGWYSTLREGMQIKVSGATGNTGANGTWYIKTAGKNKFSLWSDADFTTPAVGNGVYYDGAVLSWFKSGGTDMSLSMTKDTTLQDATIYYPQFAFENGVIKIYPTTPICTRVDLDYIAKPTVLIDVTDTTVDLEQTYSYLFLADTVLNIALKNYAQEFRDLQLQNDSQINLKQL